MLHTYIEEDVLTKQVLLRKTVGGVNHEKRTWTEGRT